MRRAAAAFAPAIVLMALAGCLGESGGGPSSSTSTTATLAPATVREVRMEGCVDMRFSIDLRQEVFVLPSGYDAKPSVTGAPQQAQLSFQRCELAVADTGASFSNVSLATVGVILVPQDRGQGDVFADQYLVETLASPPAFRSLLEGRGFPAGNGTAEIIDSPGVRRGSVSGDSSYQAVASTSDSGGTIGDREGEHVEGRWFVLDRSCDYHLFFSPVEFMAQQGAMARAMPVGGGALAGIGSQAISCVSTITFGENQ